MTTITLKINERSKKGKTILDLLSILVSDKKEIQIVNDEYKQEFVEKILNSAKSTNRTKVTAQNLWETI